VRRAIVTVDAIHLAPLSDEFPRLVLDSVNGDPRNLLTNGISGNVLDSLADMRLVNPRSNVHQQHCRLFRTLFIFIVPVDDAQLVVNELFRPMALFACILRWAQASNGRWYGPVIRVECHGEQLPDSRQLVLNEPFGSRTNVTVHTTDA
jgi:hypothetical protein